MPNSLTDCEGYGRTNLFEFCSWIAKLLKEFLKKKVGCFHFFSDFYTNFNGALKIAILYRL